MKPSIILANPGISLEAWFHAYVLVSIIGVRWGKYAPTSANSNDALKEVMRKYLDFTYQEDEWGKREVLDAMRRRTGTTLRRIARELFPSLFLVSKRGVLKVPDELNNEINFDKKLINQLRVKTLELKKEIMEMNEAVTEQSKATKGTGKPSINFFAPPGVDLDNLTLNNYKDLVGKRFRMTKAQKLRGLTREQAFTESKNLYIGE